MEFFTYSAQKRPVRLKESTRRFAWESLQEHKYGLDTLEQMAVTLDHIPDFNEKSSLEQYNCVITEIVRSCRVRICENELLSGAGNLGEAIKHNMPATYHGKIAFEGISHLTADFFTVLKIGMNGIEQQVKERLERGDLTGKQRKFLESGLHCINEMRIWRGRYLEALAGMPGYETNYKNLSKVPFEPAETFHEAVQTVWFCFAFLRLCGYWPGIGRLDVMLGDYLKKDLAKGTLTLEEAREILAHFFIKGCEWVNGQFVGSGDAQHYQNIVLAGVDENGREVTNEVTYLILDVLEELNISDFPTTVRLNHQSPEKLLRRIAEVMKHGGGVLALYNEDEIIPSLVECGYALPEARQFANDGCWEIQVPGRTNFGYMPFDGLQCLLCDTLHIDKGEIPQFSSIDEIKTSFFEALDKRVQQLFRGAVLSRVHEEPDRGWVWTEQSPCTLLSLFEGGCIKKAASYLEGGPHYYVRSPHLGGACDVGNSLRVIDKLCFIDQRLSFGEFMNILRANWKGSEKLRQFVLNKITLYGNDDDEADAYTKEIVDTFADITLKYKNDAPILFVPGISTFGRQIEWRYNRPAAPHGHRTGDILAPNMGATPGSDLQGATALIRSYCKLDLKKQITGAALDVKLLPSSVRGEDGTMALVGLMRGFVQLGGCFMQPDVVDNEILKRAQEHPEDYQSLSVRVSGWNARFVTLNKEWQDMCIEKTTHGEM